MTCKPRQKSAVGLKTLPEVKLGVRLQRWILLKGWEKLQGLSSIAKDGAAQMKAGGDFQRGTDSKKSQRISSEEGDKLCWFLCSFSPSI